MSNKKTHVRKPLEVEAITWIGSTTAAEVEVERFTLRYQDDVTGEKREAVICREHLHAFIAAANKAGRKWTTTRALRSRHCVTCALETGGYL